MPKKVFDAGGYLEQQGLKLARTTEDGGYIFRDRTGKEVDLDVNAYLKSKGVPVENLDVEFNSPMSPLNESPVGMADRAKMALGNTKGSIGYLKSKFDDVKLSEENGILVKKSGVWHKADASGFDPWELTNDVVEGAVGFIPSAVASTVGAAKGAVAGAPAGPVGIAGGAIGGAALGGGAAEGVRTSLGRLVGTYDATPEEQLKDVGYEMLLNAGGQTVGLGVKPGVKMLANAVKSIKSKAAPATVELMTGVISRTTGASEMATKTMFDQTDEVAKALAKAKAGSAATSDVIAKLSQSQIAAADELIEQAPKALSRKFGTLVDDLATSMKADDVVDLGDVVSRAQQKLVEKGYGKMVTEAADPRMVRVMGLAQDSAQAASPENTKKIFQLLSNKESLARLATGKEASLLDEQTQAALNNMADLVNKLGQAGKARGANGAKALMEMRKTLNATARNVAGDSAPPALKAFVTDFRQALTEEIGSEFSKRGLANQYLKTSQLYERYADAVELARSAARSTNGSEGLVKKLVQGMGANQTYKDLAGDMAELLGKPGAGLLNSIKVSEAAKGFAPVLPKSTLGTLTVGAAGGAAALSGGIGAPLAAAGAMMSSPRLVLKQVQAAQAMRGFINALPKSEKVRLLQDPSVMRELIKTTFGSANDPEALADQLLADEGLGGSK